MPASSETTIHTCQISRHLPLGLQNDLNILAGIGIHQAIAWPNTILLGAGGLDLEGHTVSRRILKCQRYWSVLPELKPDNKDGMKRDDDGSTGRELRCRTVGSFLESERSPSRT